MKTASRFATLASVCLFSAASVSAQLAEEYRMWTNTSGKQVEATLVSVDVAAKAVKIKMKDGREFDVPIANLSPADFEYAKTRYAAMQAAPAATPPAVAMPATPAGTPPATAPAGTPAVKPAVAAATKKPAPERPKIVVLPVAKFKAPAANDFLGGIKGRPRLIHNAASWAALKGQIAADPVLAKIMEAMKASGEDLLLDPELNRINGETGGEGPKAIYRMGLLGALHYGDGDLKWQDKGTKELLALTDKVSFRDWHPDLMDNLTDMVVATSLGYDWFRAGLNAEQASGVRTYMAEKGVGALIALLEGDEVPESAKGSSGGQTSTAKAKAPPAKVPPRPQAKPDVGKLQPDKKQMAAASALLLYAICMADEDITNAKKAADAAAKVFGKGIVRFAPAGVWPEGLQAGEEIMDYVAMVVQSLKAAAGKDLGLSLLEGIPQFGVARMHLLGPTGQTFNFGDAKSATGARPWVATWLCGIAGNPGIRAVAAGGKQPVTSAYFGQVGNFIYYNPHAAGDGTADTMDYAQPGGFVAASRSGWTKDDLFIAVKGGENEDTTAQLDIGSFVLEAGGQRWGIELGAETEKTPGFEVKPGADRTKRFALYLENTLGQNTLILDGDQQDMEAKAAVLLGNSTPERGLAVVDMTKAYSKQAKDVHRGVMMVRGAKPYVVLQDDLTLKNTGSITWSMHTKAEISASGTTAKLTQGGKTLVATIVSPANATFSSGEPPKAVNEQARDLEKEKVHVLKALVDGVKGPQSLCITFALDEPATHTASPVATWVKK